MNSCLWAGRASRALTAAALTVALAVFLVTSLAGCARFKPKPNDSYVYVTAQKGFLRDRVAAVSNRVAEVANGDRLKVLDHGRHFLKVQTDQGKIGWIEERSVATPETATAFDQLKEQHKSDPEIAGGVTRDQVYMHLRPGRESERFYLLPEAEKLKLLKRAIVEKVTTGAGAAAKAQKAIPEAVGTHAAKKAVPGAKAAPEAAAELPAMEDWWLVEDSHGHTGWLFGRMIDVDAPDTLTRYSEGQKFVGAYILTTVHDEGAPTELKDIPVYVTVMNSYKAGLPYDFDQVRVFTWSMQHHRYETAMREKNVEGYLPVIVSKAKDPNEKGELGAAMLPTFTYKVLAADAPPVTPDATTGELKPAKLISKTYRLEGNLVKRLIAPGTLTPDEAHPEPEEGKDKKGKKRR
jgi:hypothetical protein